MKEQIYIATISFDVGKVCEPVKEIELSIDKSMEEFGYHTHLKIRSSVDVQVKVSRPLTEQEQHRMIELITEGYASLNGKVESFRCQSGNVQQLVSL